MPDMTRPLASLLVRKFHKFFYFCIEILYVHHAEMVVELLLPGNLSNLSKTQVIRIRLVKGKYHVNKIFAHLYHIGNTRFGRECDHGFCRMYRHLPQVLIGFDKMPEEGDGMLAFIGKKIREDLVTTGMYLVRIFKLLSA